MKKDPIPRNWRNYLTKLPDRCGLEIITNSFNCNHNHIYNRRLIDEEFDSAIYEKLVTFNRVKLYRNGHDEPVGFIREVEEQPSIPEPSFPLEKNLNREDLMICLNRTVLRLHCPTVTKNDQLSADEMRYISELVSLALDAIKDLVKQRRHLNSEINQIRSRMHQMRRGGAPASHGSNGMPNDADI